MIITTTVVLNPDTQLPYDLSLLLTKPPPPSFVLPICESVCHETSLPLQDFLPQQGILISLQSSFQLGHLIHISEQFFHSAIEQSPGLSPLVFSQSELFCCVNQPPPPLYALPICESVHLETSLPLQGFPSQQGILISLQSSFQLRHLIHISEHIPFVERTVRSLFLSLLFPIQKFYLASQFFHSAIELSPGFYHLTALLIHFLGCVLCQVPVLCLSSVKDGSLSLLQFSDNLHFCFLSPPLDFLSELRTQKFHELSSPVAAPALLSVSAKIQSQLLAICSKLAGIPIALLPFLPLWMPTLSSTQQLQYLHFQVLAIWSKLAGVPIALLPFLPLQMSTSSSIQQLQYLHFQVLA
nr:hypothetical protein Iba_chr05dCG12630 [Ipomoea batatas]